MSDEDFCTNCGACCAWFRVSFYWAEEVPEELTLPLPPFRVCMRGTDSSPARCVALTGTVGFGVSCSIYDTRPSTCRNFGLNPVNGVMTADPVQLEGCNAARAAWGLPRLVALAGADGSFRIGPVLAFEDPELPLGSDSEGGGEPDDSPLAPTKRNPISA